MRALLTCIAAVAAAGCGDHHDHGFANEPSAPIGARGEPGYHVAAGAFAEIPGGDIGYLVTANGQGGYRLVWTDTAGSPAVFSGTVATDGTFDPNQLVNLNPGGNARVLLNGPSEIDFDSIPGATLDGVDFVTSTEPIYVDALIDGSRVDVGIFFTGAITGALNVSGFDPVAFTSP